MRTFSPRIGNFVMQRDVIMDYATGDSWIYACDNQTGKMVCNCACEKLPAGPCQDLNTTAWTPLGDDTTCDGTNPHGGCTKWQHYKNNGEDQEEYYWVTASVPNELRHVKIYAPESMFNQSENVTDTRLGPPPPSTWELPGAWKCSPNAGGANCGHASARLGQPRTVSETAAEARKLLVKVEAPVDCFDKYTTKGSCDADAACAWCTSGAVPPACNSLADAKTLPPSVFTCDKVM